MLQESEKDLPDDYNPPSRLAVAYMAMKKPDEALAASNRALPKVTGPRRVQVLQRRSDIFAAKGDAAASREALEQALACAEALPAGPALRGPDQGPQEEAGGASGGEAGKLTPGETPAGSAPLEVRGARRAFGAGRGLDGVDLRLERGEIYGLLGPNGAGKTSLVRAICGRLRLDGGSVSLLGRDPADADARRRLGLVPQEIALYPELTVAENLELLGRLAGLPPGEAGRAVKTRSPGSASPIARRASWPPCRAASSAASTSPPPPCTSRPCSLLDEPTVGVDPAAREQIHERLRELGARGIAILLATHDLDQAAELCGRIGILVDGRLARRGDPRRSSSGARSARRARCASPSPRPRRGRAAGARGRGPRRRGGRPDVVGTRRGGPRRAAGHRPAAGRPPMSRWPSWRLREPGLRGAFFRLTGRELGE